MDENYSNDNYNSIIPQMTHNSITIFSFFNLKTYLLTNREPVLLIRKTLSAEFINRQDNVSSSGSVVVTVPTKVPSFEFSNTCIIVFNGTKGASLTSITTIFISFVVRSCPKPLSLASIRIVMEEISSQLRTCLRETRMQVLVL